MSAERSPSAGRRAGLPPGLQLMAEVAGAEGGSIQLRILGDESRGFLLVGGQGLADEDREFWFATLDDAIEAGKLLGARPEDWVRMSEPGEVRG